MKSPETVVKDASDDISNGCSQPKKLKVVSDDIPDNEVHYLLSDKTLAKTPNQPPQTQGSPTAMEIVSCSSAGEEGKLDQLQESAAASISTLCSDNSSNISQSVNSSSSKRDSTEKSHEHNKDNKSEKKNSEHHHRKSKKRREKKKQRRASGNDSTGSDAPGSPLYNQLPGGLSSPSRSRISFDADLGKALTLSFLSSL